MLRRPHGTRIHSSYCRRLRVERLERRELLSAVPTGTEFLVNTHTTDYQGLSGRDTAMDASGDFVVVWASNGQDGDNTGIYAQRYNAVGVVQGSEFRVNTYTTSSQSNPAVAMDSDGDFVVTWGSNGQDGSFLGVYAQRYNAAGVAQGSEFVVPTHITSAQSQSDVAMDADGDFVIVWQSYRDGGSGAQGPWGVYAQRYNAAGVAQGGEFRVNTRTTGLQGIPTVAMDADGDFVVAWRSDGQDGSSEGIYSQRFNALGVAQGSEFRVNTYTTGTQDVPDMSMDADGDFVVVWNSNVQDGSGQGVYAQRYNAAAVAQGVEFRVNTYTTSGQSVPAVAMDADGDFVVAWESYAQDGNSSGLYVQAYNAAGAANGSELRVNTFTTGAQRNSGVAMDSDGDFVVIWTSSNQDGNLYGVYAQRYLNNAVPTTSGIANVNVSEDAADSIVNLWAAFADAEDADSALTYTVQFNTNSALVTSTDINAGNGQLTLDFALNASGSAMITVRATDTAAEWVETTFTVNVAAVNDEQVLATNTGLTVDRAATAVITSVLLTTSDVDDAAGGLVYVVTSATTHGSLLVNGTPAGTFTQQDINNGLVSYQHDGTENFADSFAFTVDDGEGTSSGGTFNIAIEPYPGDYNRDHVVDAADYVMWRKQLGTTGVPAYSGADGDGNTAVQQADYGVWTARFGETAGAGSGGQGARSEERGASPDQDAEQAVTDVFGDELHVSGRHSAITIESVPSRRVVSAWRTENLMSSAVNRDDELAVWLASRSDGLDHHPAEDVAQGGDGDDEAAADDVFAALDATWNSLRLFSRIR